MDLEERRRIVGQIHAALTEKGYCPTYQIMGYILRGDPAYITNHNGARQAITTIDRHDLLIDIVSNYFSAEA